jgi:hypothetical protein
VGRPNQQRDDFVKWPPCVYGRPNSVRVTKKLASEGEQYPNKQLKIRVSESSCASPSPSTDLHENVLVYLASFLAHLTRFYLPSGITLTARPINITSSSRIMLQH